MEIRLVIPDDRKAYLMEAPPTTDRFVPTVRIGWGDTRLSNVT